jgi:hypothetical protein
MRDSSKTPGKKKNMLILIIVFCIAIVFILIFFIKRESPCPYDLDSDGKIGVRDITAVSLKVNQPCSGCKEDINSDGLVDSEDIRLLKQNFGKPCDSIDFNTVKPGED